MSTHAAPQADERNASTVTWPRKSSSEAERPLWSASANGCRAGLPGSAAPAKPVTVSSGGVEEPLEAVPPPPPHPARTATSVTAAITAVASSTGISGTRRLVITQA